MQQLRELIHEHYYKHLTFQKLIIIVVAQSVEPNCLVYDQTTNHHLS